MTELRTKLRIVADGNIPYAERVFAPLGTVRRVRGRELRREMLADCDLLLCRSTVKVGPALLDGTPVRFVGTATVGVDHVDEAYLAGRGIGFAHAQGSSSNSVAEWVVAALLCAAQRRGRRLRGARLGIVGVGRVGRIVERYAAGLGLEVVRNDPPRARVEGPTGFVSLREALGCDYVTLHVPLQRSGPDATWHLVDPTRLSPEAVLLNAARGPVVSGPALLAALKSGGLGGAVLDCWEGEPAIDPALLDRVLIGTPHIAGHSLEAKAEGTRMLFDAARRFLGDEAAGVAPWVPAQDLPPPQRGELRLIASPLDDEALVSKAVQAAYDIGDDDRRLREALASAEVRHQPQARGQAFDQLREIYPVRREFATLRVIVDRARAGLAATLAGLGFTVTVE